MKLTYRSDIDVLRGISIIAVLLYHAKFQYFEFTLIKGGFLGVDIFFVITGFLITQILLKELYYQKKILILSFYERRARRLIPVLLLVMLLASILSYFVMDPVKLKQHSSSLFFSIFFGANFYFHYFGDFYGNSINQFKPLLHLWSLGVEEQFYILFPVFLILINKYFKKFLLFLLISGFLISFALAIYLSKHHPMFSFYMLPSRAWEILAGAILAYYVLTKETKINLSNGFYNFLYYLLIFVLIVSFLIVDIKKVEHPSLVTLIPILSTVALIYLGSVSVQKKINNLYLENFLIFFGKISYSLYLWHFLFFSIFRISSYYYSENTFIKILIILLSIFCSYYSYLLVEQKFRNKNFEFIKTIKFSLILLIFIIPLNLNYLINKNILKDQYQIDGFNISEWKDTTLVLDYIKKNNRKFFLDNSKIKVLIIGNCHADDTFIALDQKKDQLEDFDIVLHPRIDIHDFSRIVKNKSILYEKADYIILSTRWLNKDLEFLDSLISTIKNDKKKLVILNNVAEFNYNELNFGLRRNYFTTYKKLVFENKSSFFDKEELLNMKKEYFQQQENNTFVNSINKEIEKISKINEIKLIDNPKLFCNPNYKTCDFLINNTNIEFFRDYGRFSIEGLKFIGSKYIEEGILEKY